MKNLFGYALAALIATAIVCPIVIVRASDKVNSTIKDFYTVTTGQPVTKLDAMRLLINSKDKVYKCSEVKVNDKLSIVRK